MPKTKLLTVLALMGAFLPAHAGEERAATAIIKLAQAQVPPGRGTELTCVTTKRGGRIPFALPTVQTREVFMVRDTEQGLQLERGNRGPERLDNGNGNGNGRAGAPGQTISLTRRQDGMSEWTSEAGGRQPNGGFKFGKTRRIVFEAETGAVESYESDDVVPVGLVISEHTECR